MIKRLMLKVKQSLRWITLILLMFSISHSLLAQTVTTVEGVDGLTFTKTVEKYMEMVPDTFNLHLMKVVPDSLYLNWDPDSATFSLFGGATLLFSDEELKVDLGDVENPGILIRNDTLVQVHFGLTTEFSLKSLSFYPEDLSFAWDKEGGNYDIFGAVKVGIEGDTLIALLGDEDNPGIEINEGAIHHINIGVTDDFELKSLTIAPDELTFMWDEDEDDYDLYGSLDVEIDEDAITASLGDEDNPGIEIKAGSIDHINIGVTSDFELKSLTIRPDDLTFMWDEAEKNYALYGSIEVDIEGDSIKAILGDAENPGIEIKDGTIDKIDIGITENFEMKKLTIKTDSLGLAWQKNSSGSVYHLFGEVDIDIDNQKIGFSFGTLDDPGLVYENGQIKSFNIATNDDLNFGGLEVETKGFTLGYQSEIYHLSGKMMVKDMWHAEIDLGEGPGSGVTLDLSTHPVKFKIDKASFDLGEVDLGAIELKDLKLCMADNSIDDADLKVEFPPGWEVGAEITFENGELHSLDIDWEAESFEEAIEMPGTGAFITKMKGGVFNLDDIHNFYFDGSIGMAFGGPFKIGDYDVSILYLETEARINRSELLITSDVEIGAYMDEDGWHSILGDGNLTIDLKWGHTYSIKGSLNIPSDPIITADLQVQLSNTGAFNALIDVKLVVPHSVPVIGGHEFGEADGAVHYDKTDPSSFAAGWVKVDLFFYTLKKGVKYNFKSKDYSIIGARAINTLSEIGSTPPASSSDRYWQHFTFVVEGDHLPHFIQITLNMKESFSEIMTDVWAPVPYSDEHYAACYYVDGVDKISKSDINLKMLETFWYKIIKDKDQIIFYILPVGYDTNCKARLSSGKYYVEVGNPSRGDGIETYHVHLIYDDPTIYSQYFYAKQVARTTDSGVLGDVVSDLRIQYDMGTWVSDKDSATVTYLISKDGETGIPVKRVPYNIAYHKKWGPKEDFLTKTWFISDMLNINDDLYMFALVDDGINAVLSTDIVKMDYSFPVFGKIQIQGEPDSLSSGIGVNLLLKHNDQWVPVNYDEGKITDHKGQFGFLHEINSGIDVKLDIDLPHGYKVDVSSDYFPEDVYTIDTSKGWEIGTIVLKKINE